MTLNHNITRLKGWVDTHSTDLIRVLTGCVLGIGVLLGLEWAWPYIKDEFPNATFIEWAWTSMNFVGMVASAVNATVVYIRGRRVVKSYELVVTTRAVGLLFIQRVVRSNILGIITTLFFTMGVIAIMATNSPGAGIALAVGPVFGISLFIAGALITGYQVLEMLMRPEIDEAIETAMVKGYYGKEEHEW